MSLLVVKTVILVVAGDSLVQLAPAESAAWNRVNERVVHIFDGLRPSGVGLKIADPGRFLAHRSAFGPGQISIRLHDGRTFIAKLTSSDEVTGLALLEAEIPIMGAKTAPAALGHNSISKRVAKESVEVARDMGATRLLIVSAAGQSRGEMHQTNLLGLSGSAKRGLTLSEIRYESSSPLAGGALAFNLQGELVGILGASLESQTQTQNRIASADVASLFRSQPYEQAPALNSKAYGPQSMTVAYSITPDILNRVIEGFNSPSRSVSHPALGLMVKDGKEGALVVSVVPGSGAAIAGIKPNDLIIALGDFSVKSHGDYTRAVIKQRVGSTVTVKLRRGNELLTLESKVGS